MWPILNRDTMSWGAHKHTVWIEIKKVILKKIEHAKKHLVQLWKIPNSDKMFWLLKPGLLALQVSPPEIYISEIKKIFIFPNKWHSVWRHEIWILAKAQRMELMAEITSTCDPTYHNTGKHLMPSSLTLTNSFYDKFHVMFTLPPNTFTPPEHITFLNI